MRTLTTLILMTSLLTATAFAKGPVGDWQTVQQDIPHGWQITVVTSFTFPCIFQQANADELVCEPLQHRWGSESRDIHVRRDRIREIRVERREGANMLAGAGGGAVAGALLGTVLVAGARGPAAFLLGTGGAGMGASTGRGLHILHGKVIYRRPEGRESSSAKQDSHSTTDATARTSP
jgi:hypothetical protein